MSSTRYIREDGPDDYFREQYYRNGVLHRDPQVGPAVLEGNGSKIYAEGYWVNGKRHRDPKDGPADIVRNAAGETVTEAYYVDGMEVNPSLLGDGGFQQRHAARQQGVEERKR